jgi:hypothetical protein
MTEIQKVSVKILSDAPQTLDLTPFLSIFGRWRADAAHPAQWVDLADYAHMARGAGVVLIGHVCNLSFDMGTAAPGVLYFRKKGLEGSNQQRLWAVFRDALAISRCLLREPEFPPGVHLETGRVELAFNDRLETPNTEDTDRELRPAISAVLDGLFGRDSYELERQRDPAKLYGFSVRAANPPAWGELIARLGL